MGIKECLDIFKVETKCSQAIDFRANRVSNEDDFSVLWNEVCDFGEHVGFVDAFDCSPSAAGDVFGVVVVCAASEVCCSEYEIGEI